MKLITSGRVVALGLGLGMGLGLVLPIPGQAQEPRSPAVQAPAAAANQARRTQHLTQEQMMMQVEAHLAGLRTQLGITPEQEPKWLEFAKVTRDNAIAMRQRFSQRGTQLAQMSAADNMLDYAQITELLGQERMRLAVAFRALYEAMSPEQKQRADVIFRRPPTPAQRPAGRPANTR